MTSREKPSRDAIVRQKPASKELADRIERLEERIDHSVLGDDGVAARRDDIDCKTPKGPSQGAARRRGRKA